MEVRREIEEYVDHSLNIIKNNQLLKDEDFGCLVGIKEELNRNFAIGQMFRSRVEMEVSVLNDAKFPTPDAKYWQSIREQTVHFSELVGLSYEYRKTIQKIRILKATIKEFEAELSGEVLGYKIEKLEAKIELKRIDIERSEFALISMSKVAKNRIREILDWSDIMDKLVPHMKYSLYSYEDHQWGSYQKRFRNQIAAAKKTGAQVGAGEAINMMGLFHTMERVIQGRGIQLGVDKKKEIADNKEEICGLCKQSDNSHADWCPKSEAQNERNKVIGGE